MAGTAEKRALPKEQAGVGVYVAVWAMLLVLLGLTIAVARLQLLSRYSIPAALLIASTKAGLVLIYFMHLKQEGRLLKGMLLVTVGLLAVLISLTFVDVWFRGA